MSQVYRKNEIETDELPQREHHVRLHFSRFDLIITSLSKAVLTLRPDKFPE